MPVSDKARKARKEFARDVRLIRRMSDAEAAYVAGMIDGEGSVVIFDKYASKKIGKKYMSTRLQVFSTHKGVLDYICRVAGVGKVYGPYTRPQDVRIKSQKPQYEWAVFRLSDIRLVLIQIVRYLIIKRDLAEQAIALVDQKGDYVTRAPLSILVEGA